MKPGGNGRFAPLRGLALVGRGTAETFLRGLQGHRTVDEETVLLFVRCVRYLLRHFAELAHELAEARVTDRPRLEARDVWTVALAWVRALGLDETTFRESVLPGETRRDHEIRNRVQKPGGDP